ncbi:MAG: hypothetical protein ACYDA8_19205, partial [Deferrisomatales bacterium]
MPTTPSLAQLTRAYEALDRPGRDVVEVLSAVFTPVARSTLLELLNAAGCRAPGGGNWYHPKLTSLMTKLAAAGLVVQAEKKFSCAPALCELALRRAAREGRLKELAPGLRKAVERHLAWEERYQRTYDGALRDLRFELYLGQGEAARLRLDEIARLGHSPGAALARVLGNPFDPELLARVPEELAARFVAQAITAGHGALGPADPVILQEGRAWVARRGAAAPAPVRAALAEQALLRGEWAEAQELA